MPGPVSIARRESAFSPDPSRSPLLHPALSTSLSKSFGLNSPFSLSAMSSSLKDLSSSPGFSSMAMSLGRSFEERPKIEAQFFKNFTCCGLDLQDLHGLLEHFEECHVAFDDDSATDGGMDVEDDAAESEGTISGPPSPRLMGQVPGRAGYEQKKSGLSAFEAPDSPATHALHLDGGMELDMDMGDDHEDGSSPSSVGSSSSQPGFSQPPNMTSFDNPIPLHGSAKKKQQQQQQLVGAPPSVTSIPPSLASFDNRASSSQPGTPGVDEPPNPVDSMAFLPAGTVNPVQALGGPPSLPVGGGFAPSLLFPGAPSSSQSPPGLGVGMQPLSAPEGEDEEEEEAEDSTDEEEEDEDDEHSQAFQQLHPSQLPALHNTSLPFLPSTLPPVPSPIHASSHRTKPKKPTAPSPSPAPVSLSPLSAHPVINPHDPATIAALASTTLKDPMQTAAAIAALGPNSLAALPTALHPLGQGVQISPSGRPYTPPSEKPFKCTVPGCDKSYKQQNGLKYHRLHGHCGANAIRDGVDPRSEGKPYVCHVASCGKRYKNMNGLRYHYQHSGAHGALGLQMLAQGCHPPPQFPAGHKRGTGPSMHQLAQSYTAHSSAASSRASSPMGYGRGVDPGHLAGALRGFQ
ncbi:hypothetical protein JCM10207_005193 [Rhodosporidiobolus poonsookiae]